jgi:protein CpxP
MKRTLYWATAVLLVVAGFAVLLHAQATGQGMRRWGHRRGMIMRHIARQLNLTDAQKAQIKQIWQAEKPAIQPLMQQLADNRKQLVLAATSGQFDEAKVQSLASQQSQVLAQLTVERVKIANKVYNLLTPEQRTKADQLRDQWLSRMGQFGKGGMAQPPQP